MSTSCPTPPDPLGSAPRAELVQPAGLPGQRRQEPAQVDGLELRLQTASGRSLLEAAVTPSPTRGRLENRDLRQVIASASDVDRTAPERCWYPWADADHHHDGGATSTR